MVCGRGDNHGCSKRSVRQIYNEVPQPHVRTKLVQFLPDAHHACNMRNALVPQEASGHAIPLELGDSAHIHIHMHRRLRIFHFAEQPRIHDFRGIAGKAQLSTDIFCLRSHNIQGTQPACKGAGSGPHYYRNGIHMDRNCQINTYICMI